MSGATSVKGYQSDIMNKDVLESKESYKEFAKMFLKIKFENLSNSHKGQKIKEKQIWTEVQKQGVRKSQWQSFIMQELGNFKKYDVKRKFVESGK